MTYEEFQQLKTQTLENGQMLVEIEPNVWVDYNTYNPKKDDETNTINVEGDTVG